MPEGHVAYFVLEVVRELDISSIEVVVEEKDSRGTRPYSPRMITAMLVRRTEHDHTLRAFMEPLARRGARVGK